MLHSSNHRDNAALSTLMGLVVVLASAGASAWWTRGVRLELSPLVELAASLGLTSPQRPEVGYVPARSVPVLDGAAGQASLAALSSAASFCAAGTAPAFVLGLAELKRHVGEGMGEPMECEHRDPTSGDTLQHTTTGLAYYRATSNTPVFTDGWRHFALTARGVVTWEGPSPDPPDYASGQAIGAPAAPGERMRVAGTGGLGVMLRNRPAVDARLPHGLVEGAVVEVLERSGAWARIRGAGSLEGWVPSQYLVAAG